MKGFLVMHIRLHCDVANTGRLNLHAEPQKYKYEDAPFSILLLWYMHTW
jgi:hypothetical protein